MAKEIIVCLDGTWNRPQPDDDDLTRRLDKCELTQRSYSTNVYRVWKRLGGAPLGSEEIALKTSYEPNKKRSLIYVRGIGTSESKVRNQIEGATGAGIWRRIEAAYLALAACFMKDDRIYMFGFSRGALAVRSLGAMIELCGLPFSGGASEREEYAQRTFTAYKSEQGLSGPHRVKIEYMGLWDTVATISAESVVAKYHRLNPCNVRHVRQALALDEVRSFFIPEFWTVGDRSSQDVMETWFAGAHSNVGGGYRDPCLSNISLMWVLAGAKGAGLDFDLKDFAGLRDEAAINIRDSWTVNFGRRLVL